MTIGDFLYQAGLGQWIGIIIVVGILAEGLARFRLWGNITKNTYNKEKE